jgi:LPS sulfotransferase NodH
MDNMSFANLVRDVEVDEAIFRQDMERLAPADRTYVVVFTARSGSTWLTSVLSATRHLGYPEEYINPDFVRAVAQAQNSREPEGVLQMLKRRRSTPNGVFGIEVRAVDVKLFDEETFFGVFTEQTMFFNLWRDNIVAQGISLFRAVMTQHYHSTDDRAEVPPPRYDADGIRRWLRHVAITENDNLRMLQRAGRRAKFLRYEDIVRDRAGTIEEFTRALSICFQPGEFDGPMEGETRKVGDAWNTESEHLFRDEQADYVAEIEAARLIKRDVEVETVRVTKLDRPDDLATRDIVQPRRNDGTGELHRDSPSREGRAMPVTILPDFQGVQYLDFLRMIHETFRPRAYLEIGTLSGASLALANCGSIAIDPHFSISSNIVGQKPMCLLFQGTSDNYFATQEPKRLLGRRIDFAFLDGLHLFECLLRDFMNTEHNCSPNSLIAMHDCVPTDVYIAERKDDPVRRRAVGSKPSWWAGDVWKMMPILRHWRPDVTLISLDCAPTGLLLVTNLNPESRVLADNYQTIIDQFAGIDLANYGLERFHAEAKTQSAASVKLPLQSWSERKPDGAGVPRGQTR